jgi:MFS family permease
VSAPVVQFLISSFGWQTAYVIIGAAAIAIIVPLCSFLISRSPQEKGLLPDGMPQKSAKPQDLGQPEIIAGSEAKWAATSLTLSRTLKTHQFWLLFLIAFCLMGLAEQIAIVHLVYFFRDIGYQPMTAATIYSVFGVLYVLGTLCSYFSDRLGRERVFIPSCLLSAGAVSLLFLMRDTSQPWMPFLFAICFGLGLGAAAPVFFSTVADLFQGKYFGSILGTITLGFSLGGAIAPWLAGFLHDRTNSYLATFFIISASLIACVILMWLVAPSKIRPISGRA